MWLSLNNNLVIEHGFKNGRRLAKNIFTRVEHDDVEYFPLKSVLMFGSFKV